MYRPDFTVGPAKEPTAAEKETAKLDAEWNALGIKPEHVAQAKRLSASEADAVSAEWAKIGARPEFGRNGDKDREREQPRDDKGKFAANDPLDPDDLWNRTDRKPNPSRLSGHGDQRMNWSPR